MSVRNKIGITVTENIVEIDVNRLTNQIWKLIPMRENNENWYSQLISVLNEIIGLNEILCFSVKYLILLSKLEGLKEMDLQFNDFRRITFESISLLREVCKDATKN